MPDEWLDMVAEHLGPDDLGVTGPDYVDLLSRVAQYLGQKKRLKRQSDEWGLFSMTSEGISEVEASLTEVDRQRGGTARVAPQTIRVPFLATLRTSSATHHRWVSPLSKYKRA